MTVEHPSFIEWLEARLGVMAGGYSFESLPHRSVQIARFEDQPDKGAYTLVTMGMSKHVLHQTSGTDIRLELLMCAWQDVVPGTLARVLFGLSQEILESHHAPTRGSVIGPRAQLIKNATVEALLIVHPGYHSAELDEFAGQAPATVIAWALPVTRAEASFIAVRGRSAFESLLEVKTPDLMDFFRPSLV